MNPTWKAGIVASAVLFCAVAPFSSTSAHAASPAKPALGKTMAVAVQQGGVARWAGLPAKECGIYGRRYPAVDAVCYYPIDLDTPVGHHQIALWDQDGKRHLAFAKVEATDFANEEIDLPPELNRYVDVSPSDIARTARESSEVAKFLNGEGGAAQFSLPLALPATPLPKGDENFGSVRIFNGKVKSLHTGRDYPVTDGSEVKALADGTVVLTADHFLTGNAVYIDHGDGLVSMSFHLKTLAVKAGDKVKRGATLGTVGSTGRATGPHLHTGLRWLGKRIDPANLLTDPTSLPSVGAQAPGVETKASPAAKRKSRTRGTLVGDEG